MTKDLTVILEDRPGTLADVGKALEKAGINIEGQKAKR
ncbi:MAG: ACT domain-containing protein [Anaerolineae bacterium]|nr:ACT domain-containing protein [Anaerolineae bacterium]